MGRWTEGREGTLENRSDYVEEMHERLKRRMRENECGKAMTSEQIVRM